MEFDPSFSECLDKLRGTVSLEGTSSQVVETSVTSDIPTILDKVK